MQGETEVSGIKASRSHYPFSFFFKRFYLFIFRERGKQGEREGEKHQCVVASHTPPTGDPAETQACTQTGNPINDPLIGRPLLNPLSHTSQDPLSLL